MPTHYQGSAEEKLALDTFIKLSRASESFDARMLAHHSLCELTVTQFAVMEALFHLGAMSQTEIGAKLLKSGGNITLVLDNLERHGYIARDRCEYDRRKFLVRLTDAGRAKIETVLPNHVAVIVQEMSVLTPEEQSTLGGLLKKLGKGKDDAQ